MSPANASLLEVIAAAQRDASADVLDEYTVNPRHEEPWYRYWYTRCWMSAEAARAERESGVSPWPVSGEAA